MKSATELLAALAGKEKARAMDSRASNRAAFPFAATVMDASARFNPTLKYGREGEREIGKPMEKGMDWFQTAPYARGGK